jgi:hypothetical protein
VAEVSVVTGKKRGRKPAPEGQAYIYVMVPKETITALGALCGGKTEQEKQAAVAGLIAGGMDFNVACRQVIQESKVTSTPAEIVSNLLAHLFSGAPASPETKAILGRGKKV